MIRKITFKQYKYLTQGQITKITTHVNLDLIAKVEYDSMTRALFQNHTKQSDSDSSS